MSLLKTKEDLRDEFNVSTATINNWIKTGIIPAPQNNNSYSIEEFEQIKEFLNQSSIKLKKRANRSKTDEKSVCFLGIENDYRKKQLLEAIKLHNKYKYSVEHSVLALSIVQLQSVFLLKTDWNEKPTTALEYFICKWMRECDFDISQCGCFSDNLDIPNINDDFIGAFYQSVQGIAEKSKTGSYYTPRRLLDGISVPNNKTVLDPCCGSGGILMKILTPARNTKLIYARDIDILALKICRVNLSMFFMNPDIAANIELHNILFEKVCGSPDSIDCGAGKKKFDYIATNPPWGSKFTSSEKEKILKSYSFLNTAESFSIALYNSINSLSEENG
ncbi:MAG TPA: N-6 DNA methylase, partial [bacterium]|nr:N-6 DNA methylase [bacterium]